MTWNAIRQRVAAMTHDELNEYAARKLGWTEVPRSILEFKYDLLLELFPDQKTFWVSADRAVVTSNLPQYVTSITDAWELVSYFERMVGGDFHVEFYGVGPGKKLPLSWYAEFEVIRLGITAGVEEETATLAITRAFVYLMECLE